MNVVCHDSTSLPNSISSKHIPDVPVDANLTPGSVPYLARLFDKAEKTGQKEKLRWYYYSEEYEKKVVTLSSENNISDQMARTQIYDEMELVNNCSRTRDLPAESNKFRSKKSPDVGISIPPTSQTSKTNQTNVRAQSKPTYNRSYFRNKILDQYPNLYRECTCENFDYYGITDEASCEDYICPLCKLGHDDEEIEGEYKVGSYFIKCEQREIEITA
ncbi:unnamed protein product [Rhizophagus irregularis]|nr:unnamed protein product [Rhizophagus irregularis]